MFSFCLTFHDATPFSELCYFLRISFQVRGARIVTDKVQDLFGGIFARTELSEVLTEIVKMDPNFCKEQFLKDCERDIIPNIIEANLR